MSVIELSHGGGGETTQHLIHELFFKYFGNDILLKEEDAAVLEMPKKIAFTTDSFTVSPLFFAGGDIGKLAIAGTLNDLAVMGAKPLYLSCSFMIEEGFDLKQLTGIVKSMADELKKTDAQIVCGDTKVLPKGTVDKIFINTTGIGERLDDNISLHNIQTEDRLILSRDIGRHGATILMQREELKASSQLTSDCETLWPAIKALIDAGISISAMRDATRGGLSAVLNEWAINSNSCMEIDESSIAISYEVHGICEIFGFHAYDLANEGTFVLAVKEADAQRSLEILHKFDFCQNAALIGKVTHEKKQKVILHTAYGSRRFLELPKGELLPRIC